MPTHTSFQTTVIYVTLDNLIDPSEPISSFVKGKQSYHTFHDD